MKQQQQQPDSKLQKTTVVVTTEEKEDVHDLMRPYYASLFPAKALFEWLNYGYFDDDDKKGCNHRMEHLHHPSNREFCLTLKGDVFVRYNAYATAEELKRDVKTKVPGRLISDRCFAQPANRLACGNFKPERGLVFDIDMTDYDDVRTCCDAANLSKCWPLMNCAVKVLDEGLREDFGFEHILWVYSGDEGYGVSLARNCRTTKRGGGIFSVFEHRAGERKKPI